MSLINGKQWVKAVTALQFSQGGYQPLGVPAADVFEIRGEDANTLPWWGQLMPAGPLDTMLEVFGQKSLFTERDLVLATDTGTEAAAKRAEFIWKSLGPNMPGLPLTYSTDKIMNAWNAHQDQFHRVEVHKNFEHHAACRCIAGACSVLRAVRALTLGIGRIVRPTRMPARVAILTSASRLNSPILPLSI